ncbi:hypothetical protein EVG20_g7896 [Dentipellis fragilis]|uniref:F-box domain-containing protein n=1 Tax=Dentipellis fragilis TaxID=205917 RepID=A0A4Y9YBN9_9AGAM|nr:hypothetical protein EVG20_g7896 [Dentipellis fragilis]
MQSTVSSGESRDDHARPDLEPLARPPCATPSPTRLGTLCSPDTLSDLALTLHNDNDDGLNNNIVQLDMAASRVTSMMLWPLLRFTNLEHCSVSAPFLDYDDEFVESIASACPNLIVLCLQSLPSQQNRSRLTLRCLYSLAKHCPNLEVVELNRLVSGVGPEEDLGISAMKRTWNNEGRVAGGVLPNLEIRITDVDEVLGARAQEVAVFMKDIFPNVKEFGESRINHYIRLGPDAADYVPIQFPPGTYFLLQFMCMGDVDFPQSLLRPYNATSACCRRPT